MVKFRHVVWNELSTIVRLLIFTILLCHFGSHHFGGVIAACSPPVGHAAAEGNVVCRRLALGTELRISCSGVVHKNGILLNETSNVFGITGSIADYGSYRCSGGRDGVVTHFVLPESCNVCADKFVTVDIKPYNLTHINVTCVIHIAMSYCCRLYHNQTSNGRRGIIDQGLSKTPTHLTSYHCICSLQCHATKLKRPLISDIESNYTTPNVINITSTPTAARGDATTATRGDATTATRGDATTAATATTTSITNVAVYSSVLSTSISPTCICDQLDTDNQHRGSIIGEIIGSFMAGAVIATVIIILTGAVCIWTTKRSKKPKNQIVHLKRTSSAGVSIELGENNTVVRYHRAPINPPTNDQQLKANNTTSCSDIEEGTINTSSSNIDISSRAVTNDNTMDISADVEPAQMMPNNSSRSNTTAAAQVATPEQCTQVRNHVYHGSQQPYHDPQQNQRRRTFSHSSATSLRN